MKVFICVRKEDDDVFFLTFD